MSRTLKDAPTWVKRQREARKGRMLHDHSQHPQRTPLLTSGSKVRQRAIVVQHGPHDGICDIDVTELTYADRYGFTFGVDEETGKYVIPLCQPDHEPLGGEREGGDIEPEFSHTVAHTLIKEANTALRVAPDRLELVGAEL